MARGIGINPAGEIVLAGVTGSPDFPQLGGVQATHAGGEEDTFVTVLLLRQPGQNFRLTPKEGTRPSQDSSGNVASPDQKV